jgi:zinc protease
MKHTALTLGILAGCFSLNIAAPALAAPKATTPASAPAKATFVREQAGIREYKLANGLKVLLVENHAAPVVSVLIVYRVGSRNEAVGHTGSTHFLEHMLFKGTPTFNKAKGTQIAATLGSLGASYNATTWVDRTNYFETLPADKLELALHIEADRMRNAFVADADRQSEMSVVRNELERGENNPDRVMFQRLMSTAYVSHPYHHPTIGWRSDVEGLPTERLKQFYDEFYHPNNATLVVVGDINQGNALGLIEKYFGAIPAPTQPIPAMYTEEEPQQGERRFTIKRPGQLGIVNMGFHVPPIESADSYALDVLDGILSGGVTSRLHQALVEKQLAVSASSSNMQLRDPGLFILSAKLASGIKHSDAEKALLDVVQAVQTTPPTAAEIDKVKNQIKVNFSFQRHGTYALASQLGEYEATADWRYMVSYLDQIAKVTPADVQRVAQKYLVEDNRTVGWFVPEKAADVPVNVRDTNTYTQAPATPATTTQATGTVRRWRLPFGKGGTLIVQANPIDNTVALRLSLRAGNVLDPAGKEGLAALTAGMMDKGSTQRDKLALAQALEAMGSSIRFSPDLEETTVNVSCLREHLDATLVILFEMLRSPAFDAAEFDKLKKQQLDSLKERLQNTDAMAAEALMAKLYPANHPFAVRTQARIAAVEKLTRADVQGFYQKHYGTQGLSFVGVGDLDPQILHPQVKAALDNWNGNNPTAIVIPDVPGTGTPTQAHEVMKDKANVSIALGHRTDIKLKSPDYFAALIANYALGQSSLSSRLGIRVRDELGLTYGIYSYFPEPGYGASPWVIGVTSNPTNVQKVLDATKGVLEQYQKEGISDTELAQAKSALIGSYVVSMTTNSQIAQRLGTIELYGLGADYIAQRAKMINGVTKAQVNAAIKKYFAPGTLSTATAGNYTP